MKDRLVTTENEKRISFQLISNNISIDENGFLKTTIQPGENITIQGKWDFDDDPIQEGTPLVKNSFLSDDTLRKYGYSEESILNDDITVDDFFKDTLYASINGSVNQQLTEEQKSTARQNLDVYSKSESVAKHEIGSVVPGLDASGMVNYNNLSSTFIRNTEQPVVISQSMYGKTIGIDGNVQIAASIPVGTEIQFINLGDSNPVFSADTGVQILSINNLTKIANKYGVVVLKCLYSDASNKYFLLAGDLS